MDKHKLQRYIFFLLIAIVVIGAIFYIDLKQKKEVKSIDGAELLKKIVSPAINPIMNLLAQN